MKHLQKENPELVATIHMLYEASHRHGAEVWRAVAREMSRSRKNMAQVNVEEICRHLKDGETAVVPGKVLGDGVVDRKLSVAAFTFSGSAIRKISEAGGKAMSLEELIKKNPKGKNVRIMR